MVGAASRGQSRIPVQEGLGCLEMGGQGSFLRLHLYCRHLTLLGDIWGLLLEVTGIQASDELSLRPPLVYRGQNPGVWLSCSQSVPGVLPGVPAGGGKEERGERAWERSKTLELGGGVIGILGTEAPQRLGSTRGPPPGTRLHIHLPQPWPRGPQAPSNACVCTLVCMSSTVHSQCHWSPDHVCRAPDLLCLTPESAV